MANLSFSYGRYNGDVVNGDPSGYGVLSYTNGDKYTGSWLNGVFAGNGTYTWASGTTLTGSFANGAPLSGTMIYPDGAKYVGTFVDWSRNGEGTYTFTSGEKYVGTFRDGKYYGQGTLTFSDGRVWSGTWINDVLSPSSYAISANQSSVSEGSSATFKIAVTNYKSGESLSYAIGGVSAQDINGGKLSGTVSVGTDGTSLISIPISADSTKEGNETLTVTIQGKTASTTVIDTSITPQATYELSALTQSVNEGSTASYLLATTNVAAGTSLAYTLSGVSAADLGTGSLTGSVTVGSNGQATISIPIADDTVVEGTETLTLTLQNKSASVQILDKQFWSDQTGTLGPDTVNGSSSADRIAGLDGNDLLTGLAGNDTLLGGAGADTLSGGDGVDLIDGGLGSDVALFTGSASNYVLSRNLAGQVTVADKFGSADFLVNIQYIKFDDQLIDTREVSYLPTVAASGIVQDDKPAVFRFYNSRDKAYFYTSNPDEKILVVKESTDAAYKPETGVWPYFYQGSTFEVANTGVAGSTPVYRFYNTKTGHHFFTTNAAEKDVIEKESTDPNYGQPGLWPFAYEGIAFQAYATKAKATATAIPVYRFYSPSLDRHFFTASAPESAEVKASGKYTDEGVAFYAEPVAATHTIAGTTTVPVPDAADLSWIAPIIEGLQKTYNVSAVAPSFNEGTVAQFLVKTTNVAAGTELSYTLSGQGISSADITGGQLTGKVTIGSNGEALISIPLAADLTTESAETLILTLESKTASLVIADTSTPPKPSDTTPPSLLSVTPSSGTKDVAVNQNMVFTFNENIAKGSGAIQLFGPGGALVESFNVQTSNRLTWIANQLTIDPTADLLNDQNYRIVIPNGAIDDLTGNDFAGTSIELTTVGQAGPPPGF